MRRDAPTTALGFVEVERCILSFFGFCILPFAFCIFFPAF